MINFPKNPVPGQVYTFGVKSWKWNGRAWDLQPISDVQVQRAETAASQSQTALDKITNFLTGAAASVLSFLQAGAGAVVRSVQDKLRDTVSVKDFGAKGDGVTNDRSAIQAAINYATATGAVLYFPAGRYYIPNNASALSFSGSLTMRGEGMYNSVLVYNDDIQAGRRDFFTSSAATDIDFQDLGFESSWGNDGTYTQRSQLVSITFSGHARVHRCRFAKSRYMSLILGGGKLAEVTDCYFDRGVADGCRITGTTHSLVQGCTMKEINDDAIAIHTKDSAAGPLDVTVTVLGNKLIDSQGICILGAKRAVISDNNITRPHCRGILVGPYDGGESTEGNTAPLAISITNNVIVDGFEGHIFSNLTGMGDGWITIRNGAPHLGAASGYAGESNGLGGVVQPWPYLYTNDIDAPANTNPGAWFIDISNNIVVRTLGPAAKYSDYGFGTRYGRTGPSDPAVLQGHFLANGIRIMEHANSARIHGNVVSGMDSPIFLDGASGTAYTSWANVAVSHNTLTNFSLAGITIEGPGLVQVAGNAIDGDPFNVHAYRVPNGKWNNQYTSFAAIWVAGCKTIVQNNTFRNVGAVYRGSTINDGLWTNNALLCNPVGVGYNVDNIGIGDISTPERMGYIVAEDGDPASATFGRVLNVCIVASATIPTTGLYVRGHVVRNASPVKAGAAGSQYVITGWIRLTTGSAHVAGTDWVEMRVLTGT